MSVKYVRVTCPPKIVPHGMRVSCRITAGGKGRENKEIYGGAGISDLAGG
jgi:hypothetical protein